MQNRPLFTDFSQEGTRLLAFRWDQTEVGIDAHGIGSGAHLTWISNSVWR